MQQVRADETNPNITLYWCRERVRGRKKIRQAQELKETVQAEGRTSSFSMIAMDANVTKPASLGMAVGKPAIEEKKTEACQNHFWDWVHWAYQFVIVQVPSTRMYLGIRRQVSKDIEVYIYVYIFNRYRYR